MMSISSLQTHLKATGRYAGMVDGEWGALTQAGVLLMLSDGPDTLLDDDDLRGCAGRLGLKFAQVKAVTEVESSGAGFFACRPIILPEPHRFSRNTQHRFDNSNPTISYPEWGTAPYPKTQDDRYRVLLKMIGLDVEAGFASASYGKFQVMGENFALCGYDTPAAFAEAMARDEETQLIAFETFLKNSHMVTALRACTSDPTTCRPFCAAYNGTAFVANGYDVKLAAAIARFS